MSRIDGEVCGDILQRMPDTRPVKQIWKAKTQNRRMDEAKNMARNKKELMKFVHDL